MSVKGVECTWHSGGNAPPPGQLQEAQQHAPKLALQWTNCSCLTHVLEQLLHAAEAGRPLVVRLDHPGQRLERHHRAQLRLALAHDLPAQNVLAITALLHLEHLQLLLAELLDSLLSLPPSRTPPLLPLAALAGGRRLLAGGRLLAALLQPDYGADVCFAEKYSLGAASAPF